jgi:hypothetical protein
MAPEGAGPAVLTITAKATTAGIRKYLDRTKILPRLKSAMKIDPIGGRRQALPNGLQNARMQALPSPIGSQLKRLKQNLQGPGEMPQGPSPVWLDFIREGMLHSPGNQAHVSCEAQAKRHTTPPLLELVSEAVTGMTGNCFAANLWDSELPPEQAAVKSRMTAGWIPQTF